MGTPVRTLKLCIIVVSDNRSSCALLSTVTLSTESFMSDTDRTVAEDEFDESALEAFLTSVTSA